MQLTGEISAEGNDSAPALALTDEEHPFFKIHIAEPQAHGFTEAQTRAVEDQKQRAQHARPDVPSPMSARCIQKLSYLRMREDVWSERRFSLRRPRLLWNKAPAIAT